MDNSRKYMECVMNRHKEIQKMERYAKDKLTFMELASIKNKEFSITQATV
jgi:hypothetical protein